ncbi:MAG TPA: hypothetical protein VFQ35_11545 [Polyangiaceae bacterium]|nr:hypothetical protein [Polyangiaceae bacterium]
MLPERTLTPRFVAMSRLLAATACSLPTVSAWASEPTVSECLAASEASLTAGNEHRRLAERAELSRCASPSCPAVVREECTRRLAEVARLIPSVVFDIRGTKPGALSGLSVSVDGHAVEASAMGSPMALEPGEHSVVVRAQGYAVESQQITVREGESKREIHVQLVRASDQMREKEPPAIESAGRRTQRVAAYGAAGVAAVGLGVGTAFGVLAWSKKRKAGEVCPTRCRDDAGVEAWEDARRAGNISTVAFAVGGVAVVAAAALWITLPGDTQVAIGLDDISLRGHW